MTSIVDFCALAAKQVGVPYVFGGTSLAGSPSPGLDCSGLPYAVSLALGETIPRTSEAQFSGLPRLAAPERQGDLVFYNVPTDNQPQPAHVAIWWDASTILQAPHTGEDVMFSGPLSYQIMGFGRLPFPDPSPPTQEENETMTTILIGGQLHVFGVVGTTAWHWWQETGPPASAWHSEQLPT